MERSSEPRVVSSRTSSIILVRIRYLWCYCLCYCYLPFPSCLFWEISWAHTMLVATVSQVMVCCLFSSGDKRHKCTECDRAFVKSADLKRHMAGHRNEKKFICDDCGSAFTRRDNLKAHRLLHTRESVVTCDLCSKEFINAVYLKRHMHIHKQAKKKPYEWVLHKHSNKFIYMRVMKKIVALCLQN